MNNATRIASIPTNEMLRADLPMTTELQHAVLQHRKEITDILEGTDPRLLCIVGPCSAWPSEAVMTFGNRLRALQDEVDDKIKLVMRTYVQKPRTTTGWKGPLNQPDPFGQPDIAAGLVYARTLMRDLATLGLAIADEALFLQHAGAFLDLLSWIAIGARSTENQEHRIFASGIDIPVGFKNPTSGDIETCVHGMMAAQAAHDGVFDGMHVHTHGNTYAHMILRGGLKSGPNYSASHLQEAATYMNKKGIINPAIVVDASHDNCRVDGKKNPEQQIAVVQELLEMKAAQVPGSEFVRGVMLESFMKAGNQSVDLDHPEALDYDGCSITDPCLSWEQTEQLIKTMHATYSA
jgi:3-deoxy-7-phosphoheptulonate synthase